MAKTKMKFSGMSVEEADLLRSCLGVESSDEADETDDVSEEDGDVVNPEDNDVVHADDDQMEALDDLDSDKAGGEYDAEDDAPVLSSEDDDGTSVVDQAFDAVDDLGGGEGGDVEPAADAGASDDLGGDDLGIDEGTDDLSGDDLPADTDDAVDGAPAEPVDAEGGGEPGTEGEGLSEDQVDEAASGIESFFDAIERTTNRRKAYSLEDGDETVMDDAEVANTEVVTTDTDTEGGDVEETPDVDAGADAGAGDDLGTDEGGDDLGAGDDVETEDVFEDTSDDAGADAGAGDDLGGGTEEEAASAVESFFDVFEEF